MKKKSISVLQIPKSRCSRYKRTDEYRSFILIKIESEVGVTSDVIMDANLSEYKQ